MRSFTIRLKDIVGSRTFTWQGALFLSVIATAGSLILFTLPGQTNLWHFFVIFAFAQVCALFVYAAAALTIARIANFKLKSIFVFVSYIAFCIVRAYVANRLLIRANLSDSTMLLWRIQANLFVNIPGFFGPAWILNTREKTRLRISELQSEVEKLRSELSELSLQYSEQRSFAERELAIEVATTKQVIETLISTHDSRITVTVLIEKISNQVNQLGQLIRTLSKAYSTRPPSIAPEFSDVSMMSIVDWLTTKYGISPLAASTMGSYLSFRYFITSGESSTILAQAFWVFTSIFCLLYLYRHQVIPVTKNFSRIVRLVIFQIVAVLVASTWAWLTILFDSQVTQQGSIFAVGAFTSWVVINVASIIVGVQNEYFSYVREIESGIVDFHSVINELRSLMQRENMAWKKMFARDIGRTPTAATVMLRNFSETPAAIDAEQVLERVSEIWELVLVELRSLT